MARSKGDSYELSDAEKRDPIELTQQGKPLPPPRYRPAIYALG